MTLRAWTATLASLCPLATVAAAGCGREGRDLEVTAVPHPPGAAQAPGAFGAGERRVPVVPAVPGVRLGAGVGAPGVPVAIGAVVSGTLAPGDRPGTGSALADDYTIVLTAGVPVTIVTRGGASASTPGSTIDVYTVLSFNGAEVAHDDDSAGSLNSRIVYTPTASGPHTIRVTTFGSSLQTGSYTLQTYAGALQYVQ